MSGAAPTLRCERLDETFLAKVRERIPLSSLATDHVALKRSGNHEVGSCPFHGERTSGLHVYNDHSHCFGCGAHGDAIKWRQEMPGESYLDAVRALAQRHRTTTTGCVTGLRRSPRYSRRI